MRNRVLEKWIQINSCSEVKKKGGNAPLIDFEIKLLNGTCLCNRS